MTQNFKTVLTKVDLLLKKDIKSNVEDNKLIRTTSISLDESKLFFSIELKLFKGMKQDYMLDEEKPTYNTFSINRVFANNYLGIEELEKIEAQFNTEQDVRDYLNV